MEEVLIDLRQQCSSSNWLMFLDLDLGYFPVQVTTAASCTVFRRKIPSVSSNRWQLDAILGLASNVASFKDLF